MNRSRHDGARSTGGFRYLVQDDQLSRFQRATVAQRLAWLEEMRVFTWKTATPATRERWQRLRRGEPIV